MQPTDKYRRCIRCNHKFSSTKSLCPSCHQWHTPEAEKIGDDTILLSDVSPAPIHRLKTGPWDLCFGPEKPPYGVVSTSVSLLGGMPGAGKSTLALQLCDIIASYTQREIIYIGAEESPEQMADRARRLELESLHMIRVFPMGSNADVVDTLMRYKPCAVILDSLPGLVSDAEMGVTLCTRLKQFAIDLKAPFLVIDHVTKQDDFAGLMKLQHAVDTLITIYPDDEGIRTMTTIKNRFGPANVSVELAMTTKGLVPFQESDDVH